MKKKKIVNPVLIHVNSWSDGYVRVGNRSGTCKIVKSDRECENLSNRITKNDENYEGSYGLLVSDL